MSGKELAKVFEENWSVFEDCLGILKKLTDATIVHQFEKWVDEQDVNKLAEQYDETH